MFNKKRAIILGVMGTVILAINSHNLRADQSTEAQLKSENPGLNPAASAFTVAIIPNVHFESSLFSDGSTSKSTTGLGFGFIPQFQVGENQAIEIGLAYLPISYPRYNSDYFGSLSFPGAQLTPMYRIAVSRFIGIGFGPYVYYGLGDYDWFDYGAAICVGTFADINPRSQLVVDLRYYHGFADATKGHGRSIFDTTEFSSLQFVAGIRFGK